MHDPALRCTVGQDRERAGVLGAAPLSLIQGLPRERCARRVIQVRIECALARVRGAPRGYEEMSVALPLRRGLASSPPLRAIHDAPPWIAEERERSYELMVWSPISRATPLNRRRSLLGG